MDEPGSVTRWLRKAQHALPEAQAALWERYFRGLAAVARDKLGNKSRVADESDVVLCAFESFFSDLNKGKFHNLRGRDELWRLLAVITKRKAISLLRHEGAQCRSNEYRGEIVDVEQLAGTEESPEFVACLQDEFRHLLQILRNEDSTLAHIATLKCQGIHNSEVAEELSVSVRTIERKLTRIRILAAEDLERRGEGD